MRTASRWHLPLRLIRLDWRRSLLTALITFVAVLGSLSVTAAFKRFDAGLKANTIAWPADVLVGRGAAGMVSAYGQAPLSATDPLTPVQIERIHAAAGLLPVTTSVRLYAPGFATLDGRVRRVTLAGGDPTDQEFASGSGATNAKVAVSTERGPVVVDIDDALISAVTVTDPPIVFVDIRRLRVHLAAAWGIRPELVTGTHVAVTVAAQHPQSRNDAQGANTAFSVAFDLNDILTDTGLEAVTWQELLGETRYYASARVSRNGIMALGAVAVAGLLAGTLVSIRDRRDTLLVLRSFGFPTDTLRVALTREALFLAGAGSGAAAAVWVLGGSLIPGWWIDGSTVWLFAIAGILIPPMVTIMFSRRPFRTSLNTARMEVSG